MSPTPITSAFIDRMTPWSVEPVAPSCFRRKGNCATPMVLSTLAAKMNRNTGQSRIASLARTHAIQSVGGEQFTCLALQLRILRRIARIGVLQRNQQTLRPVQVIGQNHQNHAL